MRFRYESCKIYVRPYKILVRICNKILEVSNRNMQDLTRILWQDLERFL